MANYIPLVLQNIDILREEITINYTQIIIEEDNIVQELKQPLPNIHIILASVSEIVRLKERNNDILEFLDVIDFN